MSFIGAVAASVRQSLAHFAGDIKSPAVLIGAGNFTVAAALRSGGYEGEIRSCDVSLYTSVLGAFLSGQEINIQERPDCPEHLSGLLRQDSMAELVASVALLYDLREVWQVKNPYQQRVVEQYRLSWEKLLAKTVEKLLVYKSHLGEIDYQAMDGFDYLATQDKASTIFAFPPTYTYKSGYEKLEKLLRATIEWEPPPYRMMTDKDMDLYESIAVFASYFVVLEKDLPAVHAILGKPAAILPRGRTSFSHIILKSECKDKIVLHNHTKSSPLGPFWPSDREITGEETLAVAKISLAQSIRMNELFLSSRINYFSGGVGLSLVFLLDGHVFGKADFCLSTHQWNIPAASRKTVARGYNAAWKKISKQRREENPICIKCGQAPTTLVHHKDGDTSNNSPENHAPLCDNCHGQEHAGDNSMIYIMSDLAIPSCERRLAKLVLMSLLSAEVKEMLDLRYIEDFRYACTTAFADHPISMKYRGLFMLHKRKEVEGGYLLNYYAVLGAQKMAQVLEIWCKKYKK